MSRFPRMQIIGVLVVALFGVWSMSAASAQDTNLVGRLRANAPGVELRRVNTEVWVPINIESLIGVGDSVRTDAKGQATLSFMDGTLTLQALPNTELSLEAFSGKPDDYTLVIRGTAGFTRQRTSKPLDDKTRFRFVTPGFEATIISGESETRIEPSGRATVLAATTGGQVSVRGKDEQTATVTRGTGLRAAAGAALSEVVAAVSFPTLDIALDGCPSTISLPGDMRQNVRLGASRDFPRVGSLDDNTAIQVLGVATSGGWYRIQFFGGFGWVNAARLPLPANCIGLRVFPDKHGPEDKALYKGLPEPIQDAPPTLLNSRR
ncbi:MAG: SH3 domain-containing protein [Anaerolineae bacterium]|nr:SH3 domain-containing protein [Anaerolineae bacterium]